jgi:methionyl-tRNA formyltransferase
MPSDPRVVLITGDKRRHAYVARALAGTLELVGVVSERKFPVERTDDIEAAADRRVIDHHFAERDEVEADLLGTDRSFPGVPRLDLATGESNALQTFEWVRARRPDAIVLYGSSIIKPPLLDAYEGRMINMHLGLSPYYRGSGTNFWPLVDGHPECVGVTIHLATSKVDAGGILAQVRPDATPGDGAHHFGTKTVRAAAEALPGIVRRYLNGEMQPQGQDLSRGKLCRRKDFGADAVRTMWSNLEGGMVEDYLADQDARQGAYPIIEP